MRKKTESALRSVGRDKRKKLPLLAAFVALVASLALMSAGGASADGSLSWTGQGVTAGQLNTTQCDESNTPYLLWVFTLGGGSNTVTDATLTVDGNQYSPDSMGNGEVKFTTPFYALDPSVTSASVAYVGTLGDGDANLVISHGCPGPTASTTTVATQINLWDDGDTTALDGTHVPNGSTVADQATVTAADSSTPQGSVSYVFYNNIGCTPEGSAAGGGALNNGVSPFSDPQGPLTPGSYSFKASFTSSDPSKWTDGVGPCEPLTVDGQQSSVVTHIHSGDSVDPSSLLVGTTIHDEATVSPVGEGSTPTGTVTFVSFAGTGCDGRQLGSEEVPLVDAGARSSDVSLPSGGLSYLVTYNGDGTYSPSTAECENVGSTDPVTTTTVTTTPAPPANPPAPPAPPASPAPPAPAIDLAIVKTSSSSSVALGGRVTWTLSVRNNGPDPATGVKVADPLPAGIGFVSVTTSQGTCTGGQVVSCDLGGLAVGPVVVIQIVTTATSTATNTATVVGNESEANTANNSSAAATAVRGAFKPPAKFCTAVAVSPKSIFVGRTSLLTLKVSQNGKPAAGIRIRLKGPVGLVTKKSNTQGVVKTKVKANKAGIVSFSPVAHAKCTSPRIGVVGVFTPPVTG